MQNESRMKMAQTEMSTSDQFAILLEQSFHAALSAMLSELGDALNRQMNRPLARQLNRQSHQSNQLAQFGIAVAYSGGLDSSVLLHLAAQFAHLQQIPIYAFHINHGLSPHAQDWQQFCFNTAAQLGVHFQSKSVQVKTDSGDGIEASARKSRYLALGGLCAEANIPLLLTAHHQDDQAETVLLQLMRGSGVAGLSGMSPHYFAPGLLGHDGIAIGRPLLGRAKNTLIRYAQQHSIAFVDDESNSNTQFARNGLRHQVMPMLAAISPDYAERLARTARHAQSTVRLLTELAQLDLAHCQHDAELSVEKMRQLSSERVDNLLRYWIGKQGVRMPSTARLAEMRQQLFSLRDDARISVQHERILIHRYQGKVFAEPIGQRDANEMIQFAWRGEASLKFPSFGGVLYFERAKEGEGGVSAVWLLQQALTLRWRQGGERLRLAKNRPSREIKKHFQSLHIPFWQREQLPFVMRQQDVLFAAGVGMNAEFYSDPLEPEKAQEDLIRLAWHAD